MSEINSVSGQATEHKPEPMTEAGCEGKVSRNVQGTDQRSGFAELRARWQGYRRVHAQHGNWLGAWALDSVLKDIDDLEADAKDAST